MFRRRRPTRSPETNEDELAAAFVAYGRLRAPDVPAFEMMLIGGFYSVLEPLTSRHVFGERQASDLFSCIPIAAQGIGGVQRRGLVPTWEPSYELTCCRNLLSDEAAGVAADPRPVMQLVIPPLQQDLATYAGDATRQAASAWLLIMLALVTGGSRIEAAKYQEWMVPALIDAFSRWGEEVGKLELRG